MGHRVIVTPQGRPMVLQELHGRHLGVTQMKSLAHGIVWWPKVVDEIDSLIGPCFKCQVQQDSPPLAPLYSLESAYPPMVKVTY